MEGDERTDATDGLRVSLPCDAPPAQTRKGWGLDFDELLDRTIGPRGTPEREEHERAVSALKRRYMLIERATGWMRRTPIVGRLVWVFWNGLLADGPRATCKPRWGMLTFAFLNDGVRPTVWHTWASIRRSDVGIWPEGAPASREEAIGRDWIPPSWRADWDDPAMDVYDDDDGRSQAHTEIRRNDDGTIDEVVLYDAAGRCTFHLEQLDDDLWYFGLYPDPDAGSDANIQFDIVRRKKRVDVVEQ